MFDAPKKTTGIPLKMKTRKSLRTLLAVFLIPMAGHAATTVNLNAVADTAVFHRDGSFAYNTTNYGTATQLDTSQFGAGIWAMSYLRFDLSSLPEGAVITSATLTLTKGAAANIASFPVVRNDTITAGRFGVFGLLDVDGNTAQNWGETVLTADGTNGVGSEVSGGANPQFDVDRTLSLDGVGEFIGGDSLTAGVAGTGESSPLIQFLQARYEAETHTGLTTFIVDFMEDASTGARGFVFNSREADAGEPVLSITYELIPEPTTAFLGALGALGLLRRRRC